MNDKTSIDDLFNGHGKDENQNISDERIKTGTKKRNKTLDISSKPLKSDEDAEDMLLNNNVMISQITDLSLDKKDRISALEQYFTANQENTIELISKLTGMYQFSGTRILEDYLILVCKNKIISSFLKLEASKGLLSFQEDEEEIDVDDNKEMVEIKKANNKRIKKQNDKRKKHGYKMHNLICSTLKDLPTPCTVSAILILMECKNYIDECDLYFRKVINDAIIECDYRYKIILSLEKNDKILNRDFYIRNACSDFLYNTSNMTMYRILSSQCLLQKYLDETVDVERVNLTLLSFAEDDGLDYDLRADAADTLMNLGTEYFKNRALEIIDMLGRMKGTVRTVFENAQNVHTKEVEASVIEILEFLSSVPTMCIDGEPIDLNYIFGQLESIMKEQISKIPVEFDCKNCKSKEFKNFCSEYCEKQFTSHSKIRMSLNRILMDRSMYSKFNNNLGGILCKLWSYITEHDQKEELKIRLLQELEDMSGTCSTGFASRLLNVISGFGKFSVRISWEEQIIGNVAGRLNAKIKSVCDDNSVFRTDKFEEVIDLWLNRNIEIKKEFSKTLNIGATHENKLGKFYIPTINEEQKNIILEDFQGEVLNEMTITSSKFSNRQNFLLFFRTYISSIREEMVAEFVDFISDTDFDLYFRSAIIAYEGENY
jgi:hypothetical protein